MKKILLFVGLLTGNYSFACSCEDWVPTTQQYLERCESIFTARLIDAKYIEAKANSNHVSFPVVEGTLSTPVEIFKGNPKNVTGLRAAMEGTSCEGALEVGKIYIICSTGESYVPVAQCGLTMPTEWGNGRWAYNLFKEKK